MCPVENSVENFQDFIDKKAARRAKKEAARHGKRFFTPRKVEPKETPKWVHDRDAREARSKLEAVIGTAPPAESCGVRIKPAAIERYLRREGLYVGSEDAGSEQITAGSKAQKRAGTGTRKAKATESTP